MLTCKCLAWGADAGQSDSGDQGGVLQYSGGYANVTSQAYAAVPHTQNWQQCASACAADGDCLAWTRVAGEGLQGCVRMNAGKMLRVNRLTNSYHKKLRNVFIAWQCSPVWT